MAGMLALRLAFRGGVRSAEWTLTKIPLFRELNAVNGAKFMYTQGFEPFMLTMKIGALGGLMLALPFIIYQLWLFIAPGLYTHEKKMAIPFVLFCTVFFLIGAAFSHYVAFPWTWKFFLGWETQYMEFRPTIADTFGLYVKMILAFGLIFQMPTIVCTSSPAWAWSAPGSSSSTRSTPCSRSSSSRRSSAPAPTSSPSA